MQREKTAPTVLAEVMNERRVELRMKWDEIASEAGITPAYLRKIRTGEVRASDLTTARLEDVLKWQPGTIDALESGQRPPSATRREATPPAGTKRSGAPTAQTLADVLLERGLRTLDELVLSDHVQDPLVQELLASESFPDDFKDRWLVSYSVMRRELHEATRQAKEKPRDQ
jgi:transcriptional regulator with XRE-family HTH domain